MNYLALIGWSPARPPTIPARSRSCCRCGSWRGASAIEDVGHSAGVFDVEKLAWMNRHYMKVAAPARIAAESIRYFIARGYVQQRTDEAIDYIGSLLPMAVGSVDRLEEIPGSRAVHLRLRSGGGAGVAKMSASMLARARGARRHRWRCRRRSPVRCSIARRFARSAARVKERTGRRGSRCSTRSASALTGRDGGPELDLAVPAIERGALAAVAGAGVARILACRERAQLFAQAIS